MPPRTLFVGFRERALVEEQERRATHRESRRHPAPRRAQGRRPSPSLRPPAGCLERAASSAPPAWAQSARQRADTPFRRLGRRLEPVRFGWYQGIAPIEQRSRLRPNAPCLSSPSSTALPSPSPKRAPSGKRFSAWMEEHKGDLAGFARAAGAPAASTPSSTGGEPVLVASRTAPQRPYEQRSSPSGAGARQVAPRGSARAPAASPSKAPPQKSERMPLSGGCPSR